MISLRASAPDDEPFLLRVYAGTRREELEVTGWDEAQKEAFVRMQFAARERYYRDNYEPASFDVVLVDGVPVGLLYVARWPDEIRIIDVAVLPEHRGVGTGTAVLEQVLAEGAASGLSVTIHVERFNRAIRLYRRLGFVEVEDRGMQVLMARPAPSQVNTAS